MAQKINPVSFRLGTIQVWSNFFQNYGNYFNPYSLILHRQLQVTDYLNRFFPHVISFLTKAIEFFQRQNFLNIQYVQKTKDVDKTNFSTLDSSELLKVTTKQLHNDLESQLVYGYTKNQWLGTSNLLINYVYFSAKQGNSFKKIIQNICKMLTTHLNTIKISYSTKGVVRLSLKGFKIQLAGRFDNSRNQMAKLMKQSIGSLPLTRLESYVEYSHKEFYTKHGVCGLQIWLFYEIVQ
uniref:Ribosomal protein S3 n=1 Tax=Ahnfeltia plicata TaxID=28023 RepID=A0A0A7A780_9FLOR|nr:ribosomal protein S3 [Ahnfeltia plicata]AHB62102.1 ribosomal protein S3 [Ahnfeltia plicata]